VVGLKIKKLFLTIFFIFLIACATKPTPEEIAKLDYGNPPTAYKAAVRQYFQEVLFDPFSAYYKFCNEPQKTWIKESPLFGGKLLAGWIVFVKVNAKNRLGGYVGWKTYGFLFKDDKIIRIFDDFMVRSIWGYIDCPGRVETLSH